MISKKKCFMFLAIFLGGWFLMFCFFFIGREKLGMGIWQVFITTVGVALISTAFSFFNVVRNKKGRE